MNYDESKVGTYTLPDPLRLDNGAAVGTLCVIDTRPRQFTESKIRLLEDLAQLAVEELRRPRPGQS